MQQAYKFRISFDRYFARLGEHDTRTDKDGAHVDIQIERTIKHGHYIGGIYLNDIAMVYLIDDVEFNGMRFFFHFALLKA